MPAPTVVILAAGEGTRMRSTTPKVLHPLCGRPMIRWSIVAAQGAGAGRVVVVDGPRGALNGALPDGVATAIQQEPRGTGDAVRAAAPEIDPDASVIVINGDVPLITSEAIAALARAHEGSAAVATMATMELDDPSGYGRVVRGADGSVERVVETKTPGDATPEELAIREVNTGVFAFDGGALLDALGRLRPDNVQGELYLPDVLPLLRARRPVGAGAPRHRPVHHARCQRPRGPRARERARPTAHPRGPPARRGDDRRPREHADRGRRDDRARHGDRALVVPARRDEHRPRLRRSAR